MNKLIEWIKAQLGIETKEEVFIKGYAAGVSHGVIKAKAEEIFTGKRSSQKAAPKSAKSPVKKTANPSNIKRKSSISNGPKPLAKNPPFPLSKKPVKGGKAK